MTKTKLCSKCGLDKPLSEYYSYSKLRPKLMACCKACKDKLSRKSARESLTTIPKQIETARRKRQTPRGRAQNIKSTIGWYARYPEKYSAQRKFKKAIQRGKIVREPCVVCGGIAQGHHEDYNLPYDVLWLCSTHHNRVHPQIQYVKETNSYVKKSDAMLPSALMILDSYRRAMNEQYE